MQNSSVTVQKQHTVLFSHCVRIPVYILHQNKNGAPIGTPFLFWRRGRDSNPRVLAHKLISSQPRYDHFDTSAYYKIVKFESLLVLPFQKYSRFVHVAQPRFKTPYFRYTFRKNSYQLFLLTYPLCPVAVPKICCSLVLRQILTAATPYASLHHPPGALGNVPTSIPLQISRDFCIIARRQGFCKRFLKKNKVFPKNAKNTRKRSLLTDLFFGGIIFISKFVGSVSANKTEAL